MALVVAGVLAVWLLRRAPEPPTPAWRVEVEDVTDADHARFESVTGATGRPQRVGDLLLATVVTSSAGRYLADMTGSVLVAVDPVTGEIVWQLPFAAPDERSVTRCAVTDAATIICVGAVDAGKGLEVLTVDPATGSILERLPAATRSPAAVVPLGDGVLVVTRFGDLAALGAGGDVRWEASAPGPVIGSPAIAQVGDAVLLEHDDERLLVAPDGTVRTASSRCEVTVVAGEVWACGDNRTTGYDAAGDRLWEVSGELVEGDPGAVTVHEAGLARAVDPVSGTEGPAVRLVDGEGSAAARQHVLPDAVVLTAETTGPDDPMTPLASTVTLLDPETHEAVWRRPLDDPGVLLAEVALVGGTVVVVGESVHGLDAATGVVRWERTAPALPGPVLAAADGVVVAGGSGALAGYRLLAG